MTQCHLTSNNGNKDIKDVMTILIWNYYQIKCRGVITGWTDGWMDGWIDGWIDGCIDG